MDSVELVGRVLVSLVVVLAVVWVLGRKFRRGGKGHGGSLIDVLGRQQLSRTASVAVVRVGSQALVVGITESQVNVLGHTDLAAALAEVSVPLVATRAAEAPARRSSRGRTAVAPKPTTSSAAPKPTSPSPAPHGPVNEAGPRGPLTGSALSPATWRQTIESLRDLTAH